MNKPTTYETAVLKAHKPMTVENKERTSFTHFLKYALVWKMKIWNAPPKFCAIIQRGWESTQPASPVSAVAGSCYTQIRSNINTIEHSAAQVSELLTFDLSKRFQILICE